MTQRLEFDWRPGWRTSKFHRLLDESKQRRHNRIVHECRKAAELYGITPKDHAVMITVTVDMGKRGKRYKGMNIGEISVLGDAIREALAPNYFTTIAAVTFKPIQYAKMLWTKEQRRNHLKVANRIRKSKPGLSLRMRRQVFGPSITVRIT